MLCRLHICALLLLIHCAYATDSLYIVSVPSDAEATGANAFIYLCAKNQAEKVGTIDMGSYLCGMALDEEDGFLYVFGTNDKAGGRGYATRYNLDPGFSYQPMLLPFPPNLDLYLDIAGDASHAFAWNPKIPGESYELYELNYKGNSVKAIPNEMMPKQYRCYSQQGPFAINLCLSVDAVGVISYYHGKQIFPSPFAMPAFMRKEIPDSVGIYNWRCFASDAHTFAVAARDEKSDMTYITICNRDTMRWKSMAIAGASTAPLGKSPWLFILLHSIRQWSSRDSFEGYHLQDL